MDPTAQIENFADLVACHKDPNTAPDTLRDLDRLRYETVPAKVATRQANGNAYLAKDEAVGLVEWKL
jgi:hypothetical protein